MGFVYVVRFIDKVKIGRSNIPVERIRQLTQVNMQPVLETWISPETKDYGAYEMKLLSHFKPFKVRGEYVSASFEAVVKAASELFAGKKLEAEPTGIPWPETRRRAKKLAKIIGKTVGRTWDEAIREKAKAEAMKLKVRVEAEYAHCEAEIPT